MRAARDAVRPAAGRETVYCPRFGTHVAVQRSPVPLHDGHATLPDGGEVVCLDFGDRCDGPTCAALGTPRIVMAVRLARSGLRPGRLHRVRAVCDGCLRYQEMEVVDETHAHCPACDTINIWTLMRIDGEEWAAVTGKRAEEELR